MLVEETGNSHKKNNSTLGYIYVLFYLNLTYYDT